MSDEQFIQEAMHRLTTAGEVALSVAGLDVVADIRRSLDASVEQEGGSTIRSLPGEAPRKGSGALQDGIASQVIESGQDELTLEVTSSAPYSAALEDGTATCRPRPFMAPAYDRMTQDLPDRLADVMASVLAR